MIEYYTEALLQMRCYLILDPKARNARAAQDMIYEWEGLLGK